MKKGFWFFQVFSIPSEYNVYPSLHNKPRKFPAAKGYRIAPQIINLCPQNRYIPHCPRSQPGPDSAFIPDKSLLVQNLHQLGRTEHNNPLPSEPPIRLPKHRINPAGRSSVIGNDAEFPVRLPGELGQDVQTDGQQLLPQISLLSSNISPYVRFIPRTYPTLQCHLLSMFPIAKSPATCYSIQKS